MMVSAKANADLRLHYFPNRFITAVLKIRLPHAFYSKLIGLTGIRGLMGLIVRGGLIRYLSTMNLLWWAILGSNQ